MKRLSLFARTFLLLLAALLVALALGLALLLGNPPVRPAGVPLSEVIALLSSRLPADDARLTVEDNADAPQPPAGYREDLFIRGGLARLLGVEDDQVRFFRSMHFPGPGPMVGPDPSRRDQPGPPGPRPGDGMPQQPWPMPGLIAGGPPMGPGTLPNAPLHGDFMVAVQRQDGHWRSVSHRTPGPLPSVARQVLLLFLLGSLAMLPLAWWFSRALSAPISSFARAADRLGSDPDAPPLRRTGPKELARAADSFNTMQARITRLLQERTVMIGAIAHDLRTPLARLSFRLDMLPPKARDSAEADIAEMGAMITAALEFLREQNQRGPRERLDFGPLVESVVDDLADTGREVTLTAPASALLHGDPLALRRAVSNLVDNAIKYGQRARVQLARDGDSVVLHVDDDGPGIDPAREDALFLPFARGEASRNRDTGGIGLGLSVARGVVLDHGGTIRLCNRSEGGLRATVRLPCLPATSR